MMIKYRARFESVEKVEVAGETENFVKFSNGRRDAKQSDWQGYFDTFEEGKQFLINKAKKNVQGCQNSLDYANEQLQKIEKLNESKP